MHGVTVKDVIVLLNESKGFVSRGSHHIALVVPIVAKDFPAVFVPLADYSGIRGFSRLHV
jgi:hypothetical protein